MIQEKASTIDSLTVLRNHQAELKQRLMESEDKLGVIWNDIFHNPVSQNLNSPTQRAVSLITSYAGVIDGAILGWKLYRKFNGTVKGFKKKKK